MARMIFRPAHRFNYDSATRQLDTGDLDHILDTESDIGYAFSLVVAAAIDAGLADFSENFIAENDLLTQADADALYELIGAVAAHVAEVDPHTQYTTAAELAAALASYVTSAGLASTLADYSTTAVANTLYEAIGAAAAAVAAHEAAGDPHPQYLTQAEADALYDGTGAVSTHEAAGNPHPIYLTEAEADALYSDIAHNHDADYMPLFARDADNITTASLADDAEDTGTVVLAAGYRLLQISVDRACRVRLYMSSAQRTSDSARAVGTDVDVATDHGLVLEFVTEGSMTDYKLSPIVDGFCPTGSTVYWAITNLSGSTSTVSVDLDWIRTE